MKVSGAADGLGTTYQHYYNKAYVTSIPRRAPDVAAVLGQHGADVKRAHEEVALSMVPIV